MRGARINELDLLRFLAALAVVFFHYTFRGYAADGLSMMPYPWLAPLSKYGYLGVDLFFIISGFVILMTAAGGSLRGFVVSRVVRLYPAFWACCTITAALTVAMGGAHFHASLGQYLVNMTMFSEFARVPSIDGSYWSLFVELKFYALVAAVLLAGRIHQVLGLMVCWLLASIVLEIVPSYTASYFLVADYSAYFIAGATCFLIWSQGVSRSKTAILAVCWCLAILQALHRAAATGASLHARLDPFVVAAVITSFFAIIVLVSLRRTGAWGRNRCVLAGALTYPLYLLHQNIGFMIFNAAYPRINPHILLWGTLLMVLGMAFAVHELVEQRCAPRLKNALSRRIGAVQRPTGNR
jgi:peptidoglycan/LPS O-acetylase OafA/YrhL